MTRLDDVVDRHQRLASETTVDDVDYLITVARAAEAASVHPATCYDCAEFALDEPGGEYWRVHDCPRVNLRATLEGEPR